MSADEELGAWAESDWERREPYRSLDDPALAELRRSLGDSVRFTLLEEGKSNTNYRLDCADGVARVLRIYERDRSARSRERRILERVGCAIPVPAMLDEGELLDGTPFALFEFARGVKPSAVLRHDDRSAAALGENLAATLAAIAPSMRFEGPGLLDADLNYARRFDNVAHSFVDLIEWSLRSGRARKRLPRELAGRLGRYLDEAARLLEPLDAGVGLAHGDYKFSNILVEPDPPHRVTAVIDWEFACAYTPLLDVAILMRHRDSFPARFIDGFEQEFRRQGGELPDTWGSLTRVIDIMNLIGFLNASGERPRVYKAATALIDRAVP